MAQPSIINYFKPKKQIRENEQYQNSTDCPFLEETSTETLVESNAAMQLPKLPPLTLLGSPSKCMDAEEISKRISAGPPRLTPIKHGIPVPNLPQSPHRGKIKNPPTLGNTVESETQNRNVAHGSGHKSPCRKLFDDNEKNCSSPITLSEIRGSPVKPSPSFVGRSVVKRLFGLDNDEVIDNAVQRAGNGTNTQLPAFQRYAHLVTEPQPDLPSSKVNTLDEDDNEYFADTLPLPKTFNVLLEIFRAVETVSSIFFNRQEIITFQKLKSKVAHLLPTAILQKSHLAQILTVLPNAYDLNWKSTDLILRPNLFLSDGSSTIGMNTEVLMRRRDAFQQKLIEISHQHHQKFLASLASPIEIPVNKKVTRWHPDFPLDKVPVIQPLPLLQLRSTAAQGSCSLNSVHKDSFLQSRPSSTKSDIGRAKQTLMELAKRNAKLKGVIPRIALMSDRKEISHGQKSLATIQNASKNLLEKIRARDRMKAIRSMTLTPEEGRDREMLTRLPTYVRMIRNVSLVEKKAVIPFHLLVDRLINSQSSVSTEREVEGHLRLIEKLVPEWLRIIKGTNGAYVKIDKDVEINGIVEQVEILLRRA